NLAMLERRAQNLDAADRALNLAQEISEEAGYRYMRGFCLCERGKLALAGGRPAAEFLRQSREIAADIEVDAPGGLWQLVAAVERAVEAYAAGRPLLGGECVEDLPDGVRSWLVETGRLAADDEA